MLSWDDINKKAGGTTPTGLNRGWDAINQTAQERSKVYNAELETKRLKKEAERLNSFGGIIKETGKEISRRTVKPFVDAVKRTGEQALALPDKIKENVNAGVSDIKKGNIAKGLTKAYGRSLGDFVITAFSPVSNTIAAALEVTGGDKLIDKTGKVIADKSGITDWDAFQKFAIQHPNAGEDFERALNIVLGASTAKITKGPKQAAEASVKVPTEVTAEVTKVANSIAEKIVKQANREPITEVTKAPEVPTTFAEINSRANVSKTSLKVQQEAKAAGIEIPTSELSKVDNISLAAERTRARDLINKDIDAAMEVVRTEKPLGQVQPGTIFGELKIKALAEGDAAAVLELAKSKIGTQAAQALKSFDDGIRLDADPVRAIQEIKSSGQDAFTKLKKEVAPKLEKVQKPSKETFNSFLDSITC